MNKEEIVQGLEKCIADARKHMTKMEGIFITADEAEEIVAFLKAQEPGPITLEQVAEYHGLTPEGVDYALRQYQIIISEITHGMLSKLSYDGHDVLKCAQERWCDTCELKEAQEPKPPTTKQNAYGWKFYYCPSCGREFYTDRQRARINKMAFCDQCGQAVKWDEGNRHE